MTCALVAACRSSFARTHTASPCVKVWKCIGLTRKTDHNTSAWLLHSAKPSPLRKKRKTNLLAVWVSRVSWSRCYGTPIIKSKKRSRRAGMRSRDDSDGHFCDFWNDQLTNYLHIRDILVPWYDCLIASECLEVFSTQVIISRSLFDVNRCSIAFVRQLQTQNCMIWTLPYLADWAIFV